MDSRIQRFVVGGWRAWKRCSSCPEWPLDLGSLTTAALLLLAALVAGEVFQRVLKLPRLIGWVLAGAACGPSGLGLLGAEALGHLQFVLHVAAGMVLFEFGQRIDLGWLRRNPWLAGTVRL